MFSFILIIAALAACNKDKDKKDEADVVEEVHPLEVELTVSEEVAIGEAVKMEALVTMGEEKIKDADKVVFEIWEEGQKDKSVMLDAENNEDGTYVAETTFSHDGTYHITSHVDARGQHTMPTKQVKVGDGGQYEETDSEDHKHGQEHDHHHGHTEGFVMHFDQPESYKAGEEVELVTHVEVKGSALEKGRIRYEIWATNDESKKDWLEAEESVPGEYKAVHTFKEAGSYEIQIHVENDDELHEHEQFTIEVK